MASASASADWGVVRFLGNYREWQLALDIPIGYVTVK
jgi:hypothetical protein